MTKKEFRNLIQDHPVYLDGATGTNLQECGMPDKVCTEKWIEEHPELLRKLQEAYIEAGAQILYAPTFSANRIRLKEYGLEAEVQSLNENLVKLTKSVSKGRVLVAGDMATTGKFIIPAGMLTFEEAVDIYKEQIRCLTDAGVDLLGIETMLSLQETRAALIAAKESSDLPVMVSMTFNKEGITLFGTKPETAVVVLQELGADAVGVNCSEGPDKMIPIIEKMKPYARIPIIAKANAGLPTVTNEGKIRYDMGETEFAEYAVGLVNAGANLLGGCCGTKPSYIEAIITSTKDQVLKKTLDIPECLATERNIFPCKTPINEHMVKEICDADDSKEACEALINKEYDAFDECVMYMDTPLCLKIDDPDILEAGLRRYPGRAVVNTTHADAEIQGKSRDLARKYGAVFMETN